jgi:mannose-6-phosphate isomerase-like protein (cupin superfamily)
MRGRKHRREDVAPILLNDTQDPRLSGYSHENVRIDHKIWSRVLAKIAYSEFIRTVDTTYRNDEVGRFVVEGQGDNTRFVGGRSEEVKTNELLLISFALVRRKNQSPEPLSIVSYFRFFCAEQTPGYMIWLGNIAEGHHLTESLPTLDEWSNESIWPSYAT